MIDPWVSFLPFRIPLREVTNPSVVQIGNRPRLQARISPAFDGPISPKINRGKTFQLGQVFSLWISYLVPPTPF